MYGVCRFTQSLRPSSFTGDNTGQFPFNLQECRMKAIGIHVPRIVGTSSCKYNPFLSLLNLFYLQIRLLLYCILLYCNIRLAHFQKLLELVQTNLVQIISIDKQCILSHAGEKKNVRAQIILVEPNFLVKSLSVTALRKTQYVISQEKQAMSKKNHSSMQNSPVLQYSSRAVQGVAF